MADFSDKKSNETETQLERRDFLTGAATLAGASLLAAGTSTAASPANTPQDRMPEIPADKLTDAQKKTAAELVAGPRKALVGPFIPLLRSPELMSRLQKVGEYLRYGTKLEPVTSEFVIILTARQWTQQVEWDVHSVGAAKAGLKAEIIAAIADGRRPVGMSEDQEMLYDFCMEIFHNQSVSDPTYARVLNRFGEQTLIDVVGICGYYSTLGMILNVARTALPVLRTPELPPYPH